MSPALPTIFLLALTVPAAGSFPAPTPEENKSSIAGLKFFDHNENGVFDPETDPLEVPIEGWRFELYCDGKLVEVDFTDNKGKYSFIVERDGKTYEIREVAPGGFIGDGTPGATWLATTPKSGTVVADSEYVTGPSFGNLSMERSPGLGVPKTVFTSFEGKKTLFLCDPAWREELNGTLDDPTCLVNPSLFRPASYYVNTALGRTIRLDTSFLREYFRLAWFLIRPAFGHAAHKLSKEVATTLLNRGCGNFSGTVYVDRNLDGILVNLDDMIRDAMGLLCDPLAPKTYFGNRDPDVKALRAAIFACLGEFSTLNSGGDNTFTPGEEPSEFVTPY